MTLLYNGKPESGIFLGERDNIAVAGGYLITLLIYGFSNLSAYSIIADKNIGSIDLLRAKYEVRLQDALTKVITFLDWSNNV